MSDSADPRSFLARAEDVLKRLEAAVDGLADDFDVDAVRAGNVITLTFESGQRIVVNIQEAAQEIWVAARSGGFHFRWNDPGSTWTDTRSGEDLRLTLARLIGAETGVVPTLPL